MKMRSWFLPLMVLVPAWAHAAVGQVTALEGDADRTPPRGSSMALQLNSPIELGDTLRVVHGHLKITLNDESVVVLPEGSSLVVDEAKFRDEEREGVTLRLLAGSAWAAVTQVLGEGSSHFEIQTDRAVAGVRGTVFQIDAGGEPLVSVEEGRVAVRAVGSDSPAGEQLVVSQEATRVLRGGRFQRAAFVQRSARFEHFLVALREEHHRVLELRRQRFQQRRLQQHEQRDDRREQRRRWRNGR